jgi:predicted Zn-dependent protease
MVSRRSVKPLLGILFLLVAGSSQAGDVDKALKQLLKGLTQPPAQQAPTSQPAQPQPAQAPQPQPAQAPQQTPAQQLASALLSGRVSEDEERQIGAQIAGSLLGAAPLVNDSRLQAYVNRVGRWVALQSDRPDLQWHFGVIDSEDINAFAAPGGYVLVTKGLYRKLKNEAELAGVLGHEIGHVMLKHHLKLLQQSQMIAAVGGLLGQKAGSEDQLIRNLIGNGAEIMARSLDKNAEYQADRVGMVLAARAGYDAYGLPTVLQEIGHVPAQDGRVALLYKTHPLPGDRLTHLSEAVDGRLDDLAPGKDVAGRFYRLPEAVP